MGFIEVKHIVREDKAPTGRSAPATNNSRATPLPQFDDPVVAEVRRGEEIKEINGVAPRSPNDNPGARSDASVSPQGSVGDMRAQLLRCKWAFWVLICLVVIIVLLTKAGGGRSPFGRDVGTIYPCRSEAAYVMGDDLCRAICSEAGFVFVSYGCEDGYMVCHCK